MDKLKTKLSELMMSVRGESLVPGVSDYKLHDRSTDVQRLAENAKTHTVGERGETAKFVIPMRITYLCDLAPDEVEPVVGVHTSLRLPPRVGYTRFPIVWSADEPGQRSVPHKLMVRVGVETPWPRDASVWFQVFAKVKSSEGVYRLEKAGSACLPLYTLVGSREETEDKPVGTFEIPMALQEARIMQEKPLIKGTMRIEYEYGSARRHGEPVFFTAKDSFLPESEWDVCERNVQFLESTMMHAVTTSIVLFEDRASAKLLGGVKVGRSTEVKPFDPTDPRLSKIHAPLFVTEAGALTGARYWGNLALERDYDPTVYSSLMSIALERAQMNPDYFYEMSRAFETGRLGVEAAGGGSGERPAYDTRLNAVAGAFFSACTIVANSIPYIADYADLNAGRAHAKTKSGFSAKKSHLTTESFDDPLARGADDCEGVGRLIGRVYVGFRDGDFSRGGSRQQRDRVLVAAQRIARAYTVVGVLGSVAEHARNINEAGAGGDQPPIDSEQDKASGVGAHMWTMFFPTRHFLRLASKTSQTRLPRWTDGKTYKDFPEWHERLPIGTGEGTGMMDPLVLPASAYVEGVEAKKRAINDDIRRKDAMMRLMTDVTISDVVKSKQLNHADAHLTYDPPGELANMQYIRSQQLVIEDRNRRMSNFYMRATAMYALVRLEDEIHYDVTRAEQPVPKTWNDQAHDFYRDEAYLARIGASPVEGGYTPRPDVPYPVYTWRYLIPVEAGPRPSTWNGTFGPRQRGAETFDPQRLRWGPNFGDILYKREHVALVRGPSTTTSQEKTIGAIIRHLPPLAAMRPLRKSERALVERQTKYINKLLFATMKEYDQKHPESRKGKLLYQDDAKFVEPSDSTQVVTLYLRSQDMTLDQVTRVASRVAMCPYALGARFIPEIVVPQVGTYRLEVVVDAQDSAELDDSPSTGFRWITPRAM